MVKRNDGRRRKPLKRKSALERTLDYMTHSRKSVDGIKRRRTPEPKRKYNNIKYIDIDYIETD